MARVIKNANLSHSSGSSRIKKETKTAKTGFTLCKNCKAVYFKKSWHHSIDKYGLGIKGDEGVEFSICPACNLIKDNQYEGKVIINNFPNEKFKELNFLIKDFGERAHREDVLDRVIGVFKNDSQISITTTENQLAVKLGKKIEETFNAAGHKIKYGADLGDVAVITIDFLPQK